MPRIMRWGLIPACSKDDKQRYATFNAKTVATAATFLGGMQDVER